MTNSPSPAADGLRVRNRRPRLVGLLLLAVMAAVVVFILKQSRSSPKSPHASPTATPESQAPPAAAPGQYARLQGRWVRPDGGYVLEIKRAAEDGQLEAAYFNPQPIHVARAQAARLGTLIKVEVELRDTGYPGCLYTLLWEGGQDRLRGTYYQAALGQTYEIYFERLKE